jgi:hypothetical protein
MANQPTIKAALTFERDIPIRRTRPKRIILSKANRASHFHTASRRESKGVSRLGGFSRYIRAEAGYRYYYDDFRDASANGFLYQLSFHGAQVNIGLTF